MLSRIRNNLRSFSFRVGLVFFAALCSTLVMLRAQAHYQALSNAYEDSRAIISAHAGEMERGIEKYGAAYARYLVDAMIEDGYDPRLYLLFREGKTLYGNLDEWPPGLDPESAWQEVFVTPIDADEPVHLLVKVSIDKAKDQALLIGYDLQSADLMRRTLLRVAVGNVLLSLVVSFIVSAAVVWLINLHLRRVNRVVARVMSGDLGSRIGVSGADDQFDRLGANVNAMLDWIAALLGTVRDSSNALAHDMRTPLSRHRLALGALADDPELPAKTRGKIREAASRVDGIVRMFDDILSIAKAESRSGTELFAEFDLAETAEDVIDFYAALMEEKQIGLVTDLPAAPVIVTGDRQLVAQAILNLLDNAVKYTAAGGDVSVAVREVEGVVSVIVEDRGPGIPDALLEKVKERFFRVDESRGTPGTGLGLSLANAVAGLHHGALTLGAREGGGLRAVLTITGGGTGPLRTGA